MSAEAAFKKIFGRPESLKENYTHYCPGCGHSIAHRLVAECLDELGLRENTIGVPPVGCAVLAYNYFNFDMIEAPHGRALAVATGIKRTNPDKFVLTYQGDGDLAAIGTAETIHAANRGEKISAIFINNAIYGMTGGQMAPTTLLGQEATTAPGGRDSSLHGNPIDISAMIAVSNGVVYVERCSLASLKQIRQAKKAIKKCFQVQLDKLGFGLVELLSPCPTNWKLSPKEAWAWVNEVMVKVYPLGVIKDTTGYEDKK
ncbi:MAG: 2-oxoglutarate oxidoreductase [Deltaproteobacteria bacterium CG_4_8_14_3_um_filter_51_11]|nr:2-oxoglutarate oxidoreductase [bacterium]OIP43147.1 MAG: 2-oxoglutarate oxidoreductase [Desulfobacteraceae bacterium CG2_30_51_40]PIX18883.1 MAG: 2-oxoglutarate oxidoreductase [Deltaproteobacteria bacterium CG_4_8_14_3_um_filter_51_11]PIY25054.1 MAG: 2-oxoglutarate oxidoreductase [Deltaproteobacteria bacterium CG_4_10_14_3_um_filter_51_14]PJB36519.1 MAG: 2-oxoglutarate oxidoreductase [Deltaproteobacteria bacterium CG_4_9_14_3_um_filter_51_14]